MIIEAAHYSLIKPADWPGRFFKPEELACKSDGSIYFSVEFLKWLDQLREDAGLSMIINSGYRSPAHNATIKGAVEHSAHCDGEAVDVRMSGASAMHLVSIALEEGRGLQERGGLGVYQSLDIPMASRRLHLDMSTKLKRPAFWSK